MSSTKNIDYSYEISEDGYGKNYVKLLHVTRQGQLHKIKEFEVCTHLKLYTKQDYLYGDNSDIIATDSQKNTVYLLAKKHGVSSAEEFAVLLAKHFLAKYLHVQDVNVYVEEHPWQRITRPHGGDAQKPHNHAFISTPTETRFTHVYQSREIQHPRIVSGIKDMRVLKTTQSSFKNFVNDEYRSLPDADDRIFSTRVKATWTYAVGRQIRFDECWHKIRDIVLENFAGNPVTGVHSASVQNTLYKTEQQVLDSLPEVVSIKMEMPNIHYITFDTSKFPKVSDADNNEVFIATDNPSGMIFARLNRKSYKAHL